MLYTWRMTRPLAPLVLAAAFAAPAAAEPHLIVRLIADEHVIAPGDSVHWQVWAELFDPADEIAATVDEIEFNLTFGGVPSLSITNNHFAPAFYNLILDDYADDGAVSGDTITGARGLNSTFIPLANPGGADASNPVFIYSFTMVHDGNGGGELYTPSIDILFMTGAYPGTPFPTTINYLGLGGATDVPFSVEADTVYNVPAPATALALVGLIATRRRSR